MLVKCLAVYTHLSSTVSEIQQVIGRKLRHFYTPPLFSGSAGVTPSEFREDLDIHKTRMNGLSCHIRVVKKAWQYVQPFWYNTSVWQTDRRTDRQTDGQPIAKSCFSIADARKNLSRSILRIPKSDSLAWDIAARIYVFSKKRQSCVWNKFRTILTANVKNHNVYALCSLLLVFPK